MSKKNFHEVNNRNDAMIDTAAISMGSAVCGLDNRRTNNNK
jgi:hypothetical protein